VLPSFTLTEQNGGTVAQICRRLDGIPLALELAAARVPVLTVEQIAARLDDGIRLLTTGSRTSPRRQRALRATLDWSYDLLTEPEQVLLRRVAVFAGGWTLPAAEAVCDGGVRDEGRGASNLTPSPLIPRGEAATPMTSAQPMFAPRSGPMVGNHPSPLDVLGRLVARSLVQVEHRVSGAAPEARYRLLETVRQYASERLREADEDQLLRQRHSEWCAELAEQAEPRLLGAEQVTWLVRLDDERDNVRAALAWCVEHDPPLGLRIAASLWHFWRVRLYLTEGRRWLESLLTRVSEPTLVRARALVAAGLLANWQLDATAARAYFEEGPELARAHGDRQLAGRALRDLGTLTLSRIGDHRLARELFDEGLLLSRAADDRRSVATNLQQQARLTTAEGDYRRAQTLLDESLNLLTEVGDRWQLATALEDAGGIALTVGQPERAEGLFQESLAMARDLEAAGLGAIHHPHHPGHVAFWRGDAKAAVRWFEEGLAITRANEHTAGIVDNLLGLGRTVHVLGDSARAGALLEEGLRLSAEGSNASGRGVALYGLGLVAWSTGDDALATARLRESLVVRREMDQKLGIAECLEALASVEMSRAASRQAVERALSWLGAADALRERLGAPRPPVSQPAYETAIEAAHPWITDAVAAVEAWRARPLDEVIADALSDKRSDAPSEVATMPRPRRAATGPAAPGPAAPSALAPGGGCPAGLSAREVEVLRLIVDGRTNPQIATALVLSVNTVRHHVTHILDKTGCENRAAVTAFALRHQLA
jgi:DNA-binding CsgD family transcriptional regulator/tetratricopeptide (TPR) repeat protein